MNIDFDFREFQRETQQKLAKIYAESLQEQEYMDNQQVDETYCKIQKILDCPEAEKCHPFLYSLDMEHVNEQDTEKVNKLYELCLERGMIREDDDECEDGECQNGECCDDDFDDGALCGGPSDSLTGQEMNTQPVQNRPIFTVLYSGMKEGNLKMGEFYSMAPNTEGSKEDCIAQLTQQGYQSINIMAVEQTTPAVNTDFTSNTSDADVDVSEVYSEDDSEEYLRQETGDTDDNKTDDNVETQDTQITDVSSDDVSSDDTEAPPPPPPEDEKGEDDGSDAEEGEDAEDSEDDEESNKQKKD